jgi:hypothetical protein
MGRKSTSINGMIAIKAKLALASILSPIKRGLIQGIFELKQ